MAQSYREMGMDTMERLYYERKEERRRAHRARKRRENHKKKMSSIKRLKMEIESAAFEKELKEAACYIMC